MRNTVLCKCVMMIRSADIIFVINLIWFPDCAKCVPSKQGPTCCGKGGSWQGKCGRPGDNRFEHTWGDGLKACATKTAAVRKIKMSKVVNKKGNLIQEKEGPSPSLRKAVSASTTTTVSPVTMLMGFICSSIVQVVFVGNWITNQKKFRPRHECMNETFFIPTDEWSGYLTVYYGWIMNCKYYILIIENQNS